jgi:transketolase
MNSTQTLNRAADNIRILAASAVEKAKSGHPGGAKIRILSAARFNVCVEFINYYFF